MIFLNLISQKIKQCSTRLESEPSVLRYYMGYVTKIVQFNKI